MVRSCYEEMWLGGSESDYGNEYWMKKRGKIIEGEIKNKIENNKIIVVVSEEEVRERSCSWGWDMVDRLHIVNSEGEIDRKIRRRQYLENQIEKYYCCHSKKETVLKTITIKKL